MAQLLIRRLDDDVKERLRSRAKAHGVSMEEEARTILVDQLAPTEQQDTRGLGTKIADLFRHIDWEGEELPRLPHQPYKPFSFDE
ncbi:plasmid stabilization protein [Tianweitania sp. BSSL-BM11]|uniref:Plasmid stabilization protein n=1 Tax=Tianweitania aestuarii TaxID=2814886 RepID=A0ABS5RZS2_9HYPH|nr:plasmid stabilization protein [Tianweitania aestuarii]MBS9722556.1 plasmid stabilization protein [Tianweitania aestuarii]